MNSGRIENSVEWTLPEGWQALLPTVPMVDDIQRMQFVIRLAGWNVSNRTGGPFAAAVFDRGSGEVMSIGVNRAVPHSCSIAHAEALAIAFAQKRCATHDLSRAGGEGFELVTSGQPCIQCFGMVWWSGVTRLVVAASAADIEQICGFDEGPIPDDWEAQLHSRARLPRVEVVAGVCRDEACEVLRAYAAMNGENYSPGMS